MDIPEPGENKWFDLLVTFGGAALFVAFLLGTAFALNAALGG